MSRVVNLVSPNQVESTVTVVVEEKKGNVPDGGDDIRNVEGDAEEKKGPVVVKKHTFNPKNRNAGGFAGKTKDRY